MTTDNRTSEEQAERLRQFAESQAMDFDSPYTAMMLNEVADRLIKPTETKSSQDFVLTEAQVEAAAKAIADCHNPGMFERYPENWRVEARAALVAAQGAAPQAAKDIHEPNHDRVYCVRCGGNWPCQPAPVLPSSGVDEDKLAEVLRKAEQSWHLSDEKKQQSYACGAPDLKSKYIARAVAEWLKGQGR